MSLCSICLSTYEEPVSIPCGHIYCSACIIAYIDANQGDPYTVPCPTCRTSFPIVIPDLTLVPKQLHRFFVPGLRRIYFDQTLERKLTSAQTQIQTLESTCEKLMQECERHMSSARAHAQGEKDVQLEVYRIQRALSQERKKSVEVAREMQMLRERCNTLEKEMEEYRTQRQEDLDTLLEMDDLKRGVLDERKVAKQARREAEVWKDKFNEAHEKLEMYELKLSRPRLAKRSISEDSISDMEDLFDFHSDESPTQREQGEANNDNATRGAVPGPWLNSKPKLTFKQSLVMHAGPSRRESRPMIPLPPRKKFRSAVQPLSVPAPTLLATPIKKEEEGEDVHYNGENQDNHHDNHYDHDSDDDDEDEDDELFKLFSSDLDHDHGIEEPRRRVRVSRVSGNRGSTRSGTGTMTNSRIGSSASTSTSTRMGMGMRSFGPTGSRSDSPSVSYFHSRPQSGSMERSMA